MKLLLVILTSSKMKINIPLKLILCQLIILIFFSQQGYSQNQYTFEEIDSLLKTKEFTDTCTHLDISNVNFKEFPKNLFKCKNIVFLDMSGFGIKEIPNTISQLKKLEVLYLNFSALEKVPAGLYECTQLKELFFYESNVNELPQGISNLTQLKILYLGRTKICSLPSDLGNCTWLNNLIIYNIENENCLTESIKNDLKQRLPNTQIDWR